MSGGYDAARHRSEMAARILRDVALLIGEPAPGPVALETGGELVPGLGFNEDAQVLARRARDLGQGLFNIIVVGEFKNGKTTLLNGMLGNKTLPAKAAPATAIITLLVNGDSRDVAIYETGKDEPRTVSWESFVEEFQLTKADQETLESRGFVDRFGNVEYAQVECRHPICANGVKLVDSPGLGEHISRTRVATNFLKQAQAVIFVLNAPKILTQDEREFIETILGHGRLDHVFFVVNRINQIDPEGVDEITSWVQAGLAHHFLDEHGNLDRDLYARRVFFVNARGALDIRMAHPVDEEALEATGVPALERELERFLTGEDKVTAALASSVQLLVGVLVEVRKRIEGTKSALDQPLEELEQRRAEAETRLRALEGKKDEMERTILLFARAIKEKIYADLCSFVEEMRETWPRDSQRLMNLDAAVNMKTLFASFARPDLKDEMAAAIVQETQKYIEAKFAEWGQRVPGVIDRDVETMMTEVEAQVEELQLGLDQIASLFAGTPSSRQGGRSTRDRAASIMHIAISPGELTGLTSTVLERGDWTTFVGRVAQQAVAVLVIATLVTGGSLLMALLIVEAVHLGRQEGEVKKRIREHLGERLHESLQEQLETKKAYIFETVGGMFGEFARNMTRAVQSQIDEARGEQERIIRQKQDEHFSVQQEKDRLDAIGSKLAELFDALTGVSLSRPPTPDDLGRISPNEANLKSA